MPLRDVRGQEKAIEILNSGIRQSRVVHAYLFLGPKGVGKAKTALEFAKLLNCQKTGDDACGSCSSCIKIEKSTHPDIFFISKDKGTTQISIEKIRQLQSRLYLKPFEARYKVAIIIEADDMSEEASNCCLKILEEPPADCVFILTTSREKSLPETIISRCQVVRFRPLTRGEVNDILTRDFSLEEKEARFLSAISDANIERALAFKEEDAIAWKNNIIDEFKGYGYPLIQDKQVILNAERETRLEAMDILLGFYRDILVYKFTKDANLIINIDRLDSIAELAEKMDAEQIRTYIKDIEKTKTLLQSNVNPKLAIGTLKEKLAVQPKTIGSHSVPPTA